MTAYRASYHKTVIAALLAAGATALALAGLVREAWASGVWRPAGWVLWAGGALAAAAVCGWSVLVAAGGLLSLRRDTLEARSEPYARRRPRERVTGTLGRAVRGAVRWLRLAWRPGTRRLHLRPGELVEVRSLDEIAATLDDRGTLDGLPFMPEMVTRCGRPFRVLRRADKIYDWVQHTGLRRMRDAVLLDQQRCDGSGHGGCQAGCQLLWKEAWLRLATPGRPAPPVTKGQRPGGRDLEAFTQRVGDAGEPRYHCQVTELVAATTPLASADPRHYLRDLLGGNVRLGPFLAGVSIAVFNWVQRKRGGVGFPNITPTASASPHDALDLRPGDLVRVRGKRAIEATLTPTFRNRGLWFDGEMLRFCGGEYRVAARVERLIDERSGKMIHLTNPCIVLDGVSATAEYLAFGTQNELIFWREIWLERVGAAREPAPTP